LGFSPDEVVFSVLEIFGWNACGSKTGFSGGFFGAGCENKEFGNDSQSAKANPPPCPKQRRQDCRLFTVRRARFVWSQEA